MQYDRLSQQQLASYSNKLTYMIMMNLQNGEEIQGLQKRITQLETDVEQAKSSVTETTQKLETLNSQLANVTHFAMSQ